MKECVTHHICDCNVEKLERLTHELHQVNTRLTRVRYLLKEIFSYLGNHYAPSELRREIKEVLK